MSKLPAVKPRRVIQFLEQNGFSLDHTSGSHFIFYNLFPTAALWFQATTAKSRKER